jgi:hypothetical protein
VGDADEFEDAVEPGHPCRGDHLCLAKRHIHGCYADREGVCDDPREHGCNPTHAHDRSCGATDCWWPVLFDGSAP